MLESSTSTTMTGLTQPRPRTSETEALLTHPSSAHASATMEEEKANEHGNSGNAWDAQLQVSFSTIGRAIAHPSKAFQCIECHQHDTQHVVY